MNIEVPYLLSTGNLTRLLDAVQRAGAPETFNVDFIKDLGFTSSQDRPVPKLFKYLGLTDGNGRPQAAYREFMDHTRAKKVLAARLRAAFDDLFTADRSAHTRTAENLKGWFKTKTGVGDSVADKMARTFKTLATYADFSEDPGVAAPQPPSNEGAQDQQSARGDEPAGGRHHRNEAHGAKAQFGLVYRFEIHLPDTQNVDTFRAIFKALREELM